MKANGPERIDFAVLNHDHDLHIACLQTAGWRLDVRTVTSESTADYIEQIRRPTELAAEEREVPSLARSR